MFFPQERYKKLPKSTRIEIDRLHELDKYIFRCNKKGIDVNRLVIDYTIFSLKLFLKYSLKVNKKLRNYLEEALGEIPVMFFYIDNLKIDEKIKKIVGRLVEIESSSALKEINRADFAKKMIDELNKLSYHYKYDKRIKKYVI